MIKLPVPTDGSGQGRARRLSHGSQCSSTQKETARAKLSSQDNAFDRKLLLGVSKLHLSLALGPVATIQNIFEPCFNEDGIHIDQAMRSAVHGCNVPARLWLAMAMMLVIFLPRLYAESGIDESQCIQSSSNVTHAMQDAAATECAGIEKALRSPFAMILGPTFILSAIGIYELMDKILVKFDASGDGAFRRLLRAPLHMLFFGWMREKTPTLQYNDFYLFMGIPNHAVRLTISLSYIFLMCELTFFAIIHRIHIGTGLVVSYALGEVFCKVLDFMLAPPECVITMVKSKLLSYGHTDLWLRLFEANGVSFGMTTAEAQSVLQLVDHAILSGALSASVPRRITQIYLSDVNWFIDWADFASNDDECASESGGELDTMLICGYDVDLEEGKRRQHELNVEPGQPEDFSRQLSPDVMCVLPTPSRSEKSPSRERAITKNGTPYDESIQTPAQNSEETQSVVLPPTCSATAFVGGRRPVFQEW